MKPWVNCDATVYAYPGTCYSILNAHGLQGLASASGERNTPMLKGTRSPTDRMTSPAPHGMAVQTAFRQIRGCQTARWMNDVAECGAYQGPHLHHRCNRPCTDIPCANIAPSSKRRRSTQQKRQRDGQQWPDSSGQRHHAPGWTGSLLQDCQAPAWTWKTPNLF